MISFYVISFLFRVQLQNQINLFEILIAFSDLGVHIHGFICSNAHTYIVPDPVNDAPPYTGKRADVICAAYYAAECALHLLRPGSSNLYFVFVNDFLFFSFLSPQLSFSTTSSNNLIHLGHTNAEVTQIIKKCAETFHVQPVEAVLSHELKQYVIDANNVIMNREEHDQKGK